MFLCVTCKASLTKSEVSDHNCSINKNSTNAKLEDQNNLEIKPKKAWNDIIVEIIDEFRSSNKDFQVIVNSLKLKRNIPHKEKQFFNFINTCSAGKDLADCTKMLWNFITCHVKFHSSDIQSAKKRQINEEKDEDEESKAKKSKILPKIENPQIEKGDKKTNNSADDDLSWNDKAVKALSAFKTQDENLKNLIDCLKSRKNIPQKQTKLANFLLTIPLSRNVDNCAEVIWNILHKKDIKSNDVSEVNVKKTTANKSQETIESNQNEWYINAVKRLNRYKTTNKNLRAVIDKLKILNNIPRKLKKFTNIINTIPLSKNVDNCATIVWEIISSDANDETQ